MYIRKQTITYFIEREIEARIRIGLGGSFYILMFRIFYAVFDSSDFLQSRGESTFYFRLREYDWIIMSEFKNDLGFFHLYANAAFADLARRYWPAKGISDSLRT